MYILKIKTKDGHSFKVLSELIQKYVRDGCFIIDNNGIQMSGADTKTSTGTKLICINLPKHNFTKYKCPVEKLQIGMNMIHFYRMLKSIKKKDNTLTLFIKEDNPLKLYIQINQNGEDENKGIIGHINITSVRPIKHESLEGYGDQIIVTSKEFQKIKQLNKISKTMELTCYGRTIDLFCNREEVYSKRVTLGDNDEDDEEKEYNEEKEYKQTFDSEQILDLVKLASTSNNIQIYVSPILPLRFKMNVGSLGTADIYIKSKEIIEEEQEDESLDDNIEHVTINV